MPLYMIVNQHAPEQCEAMDAAIPKIPAELKGKDFHCTCPGGVHGYFILLEGNTAEDVMALLPSELQIGSTKALVLESFKL